MAKSNSGKVVQMLSPENYIRNRARTLPIYECLVNVDWEKSKLASVVVTRQHTNGNVTACFYLVDLMCLGVKDTDYMFNITLPEYKERLDMINDRMNIEPITYNLAHNIIFSGLEFAEEYGFFPHKDFSSVTCFMLDADDDNIELIDIDCGYYGKPAYMRSPYDDNFKINKIISCLEKTAGAGNYIIFKEDQDGFNIEDSDDRHD